MNDITVKVFYTGNIDVKNIEDGESFQIERGADIDALYQNLGIIKEHRRFIITMVNGNKEPLDYVLNDKDEVRMFLLVGGG